LTKAVGKGDKKTPEIRLLLGVADRARTNAEGKKGGGLSVLKKKKKKECAWRPQKRAITRSQGRERNIRLEHSKKKKKVKPHDVRSRRRKERES